MGKRSARKKSKRKPKTLHQLEGRHLAELRSLVGVLIDAQRTGVERPVSAIRARELVRNLRRHGYPQRALPENKARFTKFFIIVDELALKEPSVIARAGTHPRTRTARMQPGLALKPHVPPLRPAPEAGGPRSPDYYDSPLDSR